jgi:signal transduction histidine kinase
VSLRTKILAYLLALHVGLAAVAVVVLVKDPAWLLAVEVLAALSLAAGWLLARSLFVPLDLIRTGADLIDERDFGSRFRDTGQPEMDALVRVYNRMIDRLREERLRLEEQHFLLDRILQVSPSGLVILDHGGRVSALNPAAARLLRLADPAAAAGRRLEDLDAPLGRALAGLEPGGSRVVPHEGSRRIRAARAEFFDRGFPRSFFLLEELTGELRASERAAYRKLIRMMSHEINNSVGSVASLLDSCRTYAAQVAPGDRGDFENALAVARSRLENLNAFMKGFAEVVRLPAPEPRPCDLRALLDDVRTLLGPELASRRIACRWDEAEPTPPIAMDKNQMEQVLVNVLRNAMEAIGEDGAIKLSLARENGRPRLRIRDTGPGVPPEVAASIFTPFFSTKKNGRGLGLTLVQEILDQHRFAFGLAAREGGGAEFWIGF